MNCRVQVDFCPFRGPDAPFALPDLITRAEKPALRSHQPSAHADSGSRSFLGR